MTTSSAAVAAPISANVIKQAADAIAVGETVHCRGCRQWHRWGIWPRLPRRRRALRIRARAVKLQRESRECCDAGIVTLGLPGLVSGTVTLALAIAMRGRDQNGNRRAFRRPGQGKKGNC